MYVIIQNFPPRASMVVLTPDALVWICFLHTFKMFPDVNELFHLWLKPLFPLGHLRRLPTKETTVVLKMRVTSDLGVGAGWGIIITLTLLQQPGCHGEYKATTCNNKWQTSAMLVSDTNAHFFTSELTDRRLQSCKEIERGGCGVGGSWAV